MIVSFPLMYLSVYGLIPNIGLVLGGPLFSRWQFEAVALTIAASSTLVSLFEGVETHIKRKIAWGIMGFSCIIFSIGAILYDFTTMSNISTLRNLISILQSFVPRGVLPLPRLYGLQIVYAGLLIMGIMAIFSLITCCLGIGFLALSKKAVEARTEVAPERRETAAKIFCIYCGTANPSEAVYCKQCGRKLVKLEEIEKSQQLA